MDALNPTLRKERMSLLKERTEVYSKLYDLNKLNTRQLQDYKADIEELARLVRIDRSESDVLYFMYEYFSDEKNRENDQNLIPASVTLEDAPDFHQELCGILNNVSNIETNARIAWGAPRGHAKSAYLSNCFPIHQVCFRKRHYILIISETDGVSAKLIEWISLQLKFNKKLRQDFGELLNPRKQLNEKDNQEGFLTSTGILVESASIGKQLRGRRNGSYRPDLVILDDLESSKNTNTAELREKNLHWFNSVVMPIGSNNTAFIYMGTIVHASGLLCSVLKRADFKSKVYAAIVSYPERMELWEQFENIYKDQLNPNRAEDAMAFYFENQEDMDKGVKVLWEWRWNFVKLMMEKVNIGSRAFGSEYMNNAIDEESQIFKPDTFIYFDYHDLKQQNGKPLILDIYSAWDIALGKSSRADYNAIITVGRDRKTGIIYVLDAWASRCKAHEALNVAIEKMKKYKPRIFAVETVQAQYDFLRQLQERLPKERIYTTKLKGITQRTKKEERIESLEPLIESGVLRFMRHQRLLIEMLEQFPSADNDDLPDALQMCIDLCGANRRRTFSNKPIGI